MVRSNSDRYAVGDLVFGMTGWQDYAVADEGAGVHAGHPGRRSTRLLALSVLGVTGMTAYFGMIDVGRVAEGDTVVVSGAAGATGSVAGQVARIQGADTVVGHRRHGREVRVDRRRARVRRGGQLPRPTTCAASLRALCPDGIDLYYDNVGGEILDICLAQLAMRGRVVLCGAISMYNETSRPPGPRNIFNLIVKRGRMEGFLVLDYLDRFPEAQIDMVGWLAEGRSSTPSTSSTASSTPPRRSTCCSPGATRGKVIVKL